MEAIIKQVKHQLFQKQEQIRATQQTWSKLKEEEAEYINTLIILAQSTHLNTGEIVAVPAPEFAELKPATESSKATKPVMIIDESKAPKKTWAEEVEEEENKQAAQKEKDEAEFNKKWYVIFNGPLRGIYKDWHIAGPKTRGPNIIHKSYPTKQLAEEAYRSSFKEVALIETLEPSRKKLVLKPPVQITKIPTSREREEARQPSSTKFGNYWASLVEYGEKETMLQFYPKLRKSAPKAIFVPGAEPEIIYEYFIHGFTDTIYFDNVKAFSQFQPGIQQAVRYYAERFGHGRQMFLRTHSSYPVFNEHGVQTVPTICIALLGIAEGETYPTRDEIEDKQTQPSAEKTAETLIGVFLTSRRLANGQGPGSKNTVKINYSSKILLIYSYFKYELSEEGKRILSAFEEPFRKISGMLDPLPDEIKEYLCYALQGYADHNCA